MDETSQEILQFCHECDQVLEGAGSDGLPPGMLEGAIRRLTRTVWGILGLWLGLGGGDE